MAMELPCDRKATAKRSYRHANNDHIPSINRSMARGAVALTLFTLMPRVASAQSNGGCISLQGSKACPAFGSASVSTSSGMVQIYPFLQFVSDTGSFDYQLLTYVKTSYVKDKYQSLFGCGNINFTDPSNMYARYTTTLLCNTLIQKSISSCSLTGDATRPLCADTCADFAQSEAYITADKNLCSNPGPDLSKLIRADFATCSLPEDALTSRCIAGFDNESDNCGFGNSTIGLCSYCAAGGTNSTDTCCYNANAEKRCEGVKLPPITATMTFTPPTATSTPSSTGTPGDSNGSDGGNKLSGGAIAGIVIGSLIAIALLALAIFFCFRVMRRRRGSQQGSIFNQPSPARKGPLMAQAKQTAPEGYEVLPGGRVARMAALEGHSGGSPTQRSGNNGVTAFVGDAPRKGTDTQSSSDEYAESPERGGVLRPPPTSRRQGSLSSGSALGSDGPQSPGSAGYSSPLGMASQQSEQLPFFKDYYSQDDIHPSDKVAVLWAYQPRAPDEFSLERGDMIKVVGIWDDGWATGIMLDERADEWEVRRQAQRDSGVSNTSGIRDESPEAQGEMKAFPLVCVCLPEHWRKTIEGDGSTESASSPGPTVPTSIS
ncbi:SH3 domain containing protein [Metarhizium brunneum]